MSDSDSQRQNDVIEQAATEAIIRVIRKDGEKR